MLHTASPFFPPFDNQGKGQWSSKNHPILQLPLLTASTTPKPHLPPPHHPPDHLLHPPPIPPRLPHPHLPPQRIRTHKLLVQVYDRPAERGLLDQYGRHDEA